MKNISAAEKILLIVALVLFSGIIFYNAFFIQEATTPTVIYLDKDPAETNTSGSNSDPENQPNSNDSSSTSNSNNQNSSSATDNANKKININTASSEELTELPDIGPAIAKRIVDYRNQSGKFSSIEEIKNVTGVGEKTYENIKNLISV